MTTTMTTEAPNIDAVLARLEQELADVNARIPQAEHARDALYMGAASPSMGGL